MLQFLVNISCIKQLLKDDESSLNRYSPVPDLEKEGQISKIYFEIYFLHPNSANNTLSFVVGFVQTFFFNQCGSKSHAFIPTSDKTNMKRDAISKKRIGFKIIGFKLMIFQKISPCLKYEKILDHCVQGLQIAVK